MIDPLRPSQGDGDAALRAGPADSGETKSAPLMRALPLLVLVLVALALRLYRLDAQSLWLDEASSLRDARAFGAGGLTALARVDQVAPLHAILLWIAIRIGGESEAALRMPSVIAGVLAVPAIYFTARRLFPRPAVALASAALLAISPFAIWYAQEARMYACVMLAATLYVGLVWPVTSRPLRPGELALITLVTAIGLGFHHYMALVGIAFGAFLLVRGEAFRPRVLIWAGTQVVAAIVFSLWLVLTLDNMGNAAGNEKPSALLWAPYTIYSFLVGQSYGPSPTELALAGPRAAAAALHHLPAIALLGAASAVVGVVGLRTMLRPGSRAAGSWVLAWLLVPLALTMIATALTRVQFNVRYVAVSQSALMIVLAVGLVAIAARLRRARPRSGWALVGGAGAVTLVGCMAVADAQLYSAPVYAKPDVRGFARFLDRLPPGAIVAADNNRISKMLDYYGGRPLRGDLQVDYNLASRTPKAVWRNIARLRPAPSELWLIEYRSWEADPRGYVRAQIERVGDPVGVAAWPGVTIRQYRLHAPRDGGTAAARRAHS